MVPRQGKAAATGPDDPKLKDSLQKFDVEITQQDVPSLDASGTELPYFGRLVGEAAAEKAPRHLVIPMKVVPNTRKGKNEGDEDEIVEGPPLYIDGSEFVNARRSDCCVAFLIGPRPLDIISSAAAAAAALAESKKSNKKDLDNPDPPKSGPVGKKRKTVAGDTFTVVASGDSSYTTF